MYVCLYVCIIAASNIKGTAGGVSRLYHMVQLVYTPMLLALHALKMPYCVFAVTLTAREIIILTSKGDNKIDSSSKVCSTTKLG